MSQGRFAAITSDLLARKGEARPWTLADARAGIVTRIAAVAPPPPCDDAADDPPPAPLPRAATASGAPPAGPATRKCVVRMSAHDYERLGIAAVKDDTTRQHLLQQALAEFLAAKERQYRSACRCMAPDPLAQSCATCEAP